MNPINVIKLPAISVYQWLLAFLLILSLYIFNYYLPRNEFTYLVIFYLIAFSAYILLLKNPKTENKDYLLWIIGLGIFARFMVLFSVPNLSDDYFRFIWDAKLFDSGINPFDLTPVEYMTSLQGNFEQEKSLFDGLNSKNYYSVYPPINQLIFLIAYKIFPDVLEGSILIMKAFMFSFEMISLRMLWLLGKRNDLSNKAVAWYAINPLVIIEFCGNLHFEGIMIAFLLSSIYLLSKDNIFLSAIFFAGSVLTKLHPLMLLPFIFKYLGWQRSLKFGLVTIGMVVIGFIPFLISPEGLAISRLQNILTSLQLYFQTFEFNASIYYMFRWIGFHFTRFHPITIVGKILFFINLTGLAVIFFLQKRSFKSMVISITIAYLIYNLLATTVHPWYILAILPFALLWQFKMPIVWTGIIIISYFAYSTFDWHENFYLLTLEYTCIFAYLLFELKRIREEHELAIITN